MAKPVRRHILALAGLSADRWECPIHSFTEADFVMQPPQSLDRITFNTPDDGVMAGYVSVIRQHLGNGQRFAWVELENELAGQFRGVPLVDIVSSDDSGAVRRQVAAVNDARRLCLADFSGTLADQLRVVGG
ncbi:hypothetical protein C798_19920 [Herbaspirillum rubrisubalbicans Os34]|uniref:Uncharacterized protein n=2 Tax=Herbaspirillum rubrisubalbicans TaxID=80842 RepID=A0A6M3ZZG9_9BURK|nr:hypothetical protein [Herbaspirillum rubrisubalbicans]QJQ03937.1 hypothetical protein C798_19920 [Herbaspirillum rubrisubalbicans Os34]